MINWHSIRTVALLVVIGVIGGIQALHGSFSGSGALEMALPFLLVCEHALAGNSTSGGLN